MQKVDLDIIIDEKDFAAAKRNDPGSYQQGIEVVGPQLGPSLKVCLAGGVEGCAQGRGDVGLSRTKGLRRAEEVDALVDVPEGTRDVRHDVAQVVHGLAPPWVMRPLLLAPTRTSPLGIYAKIAPMEFVGVAGGRGFLW